MTTILFNNSLLAGDDRHTRMTAPRILEKGEAKVWVAKSRMFAYGISGTNIVEADREILEQEFRHILEVSTSMHIYGHVGGTITHRWVTTQIPYFTSTYPANGVILASRSLALRIRADVADDSKIRWSVSVADNSPLGIGTGALYGLGALDAGASMEEAFRVVADCDPFTSPHCKIIDTSKLKLFVISGGKTPIKRLFDNLMNMR